MESAFDVKHDVKRIARQAMLEIPEEQLEGLQADMAALLQLAEGLPAVDSPDGFVCAEDAAQGSCAATGPFMPLREDAVCPSSPQAAILSNAPQSEDGCFVVPSPMEPME